MQYNHITGQDYHGQNQVNLSRAKKSNGYNSNAWITYLQARSLGLQVKKGQHGVRIASPFLKSDVKNEKTSKIEKKSFILRFYSVFNLDQTQPTQIPAQVPELQPA